MPQMTTTQAAEAKQAERERLIASAEAAYGVQGDHPEDEEVIALSAEELARRLATREGGLTVKRVMLAYVRAACAAHRRTNCLTEIMFEEAVKEAEEMDAAFETSKNKGPFWGLPESFKDTNRIVGVDSSLGCSPHCFQPTKNSEDESELVKLARAAGAIPYCKTNIPQTLLAFECRNPIFGGTSNSHSSARTCGGSSGGEAALLGVRGSPLGWGSDIGGSLRIPAAYSGCYGLKPVRGRWAAGGQHTSTKGFEGIKGVVGPMARSSADLIFASRTIINATVSAYDQGGVEGEQIVPIPWREELLEPRKLKIGYYVEDGAVKTSPACGRAVLETVEALKEAGHEVVPFNPPDVPEALKIFVALTSADGYKQLISNTGSDPLEPSLQLVTLGTKLPRLVHRFAVWAVRSILGDQVFSSIFAQSRSKSVGEFWEATHRRDVYANAFRKAAWGDAGLDAIIAPVQAVPALEHGRTKFLSPLAIATILYNVVDSTVGCLPITRVDRIKDGVENATEFLKDSPGSWILEKRVYGGEDPAYDADKMHGLPVGVQVVGRAWEEEKVLRVMREIEGLVGYE